MYTYIHTNTHTKRHEHTRLEPPITRNPAVGCWSSIPWIVFIPLLWCNMYVTLYNNVTTVAFSMVVADGLLVPGHLLPPGWHRLVNKQQEWPSLLDHLTQETLNAVRRTAFHYGNQSRGCLIRGRPLWPPTVPPLVARPSQSNPKGSGPEVVKREQGHVTSKSGVSGGGCLQGPPA